MMENLSQQEVEHFLRNNPDFVSEWRSRHYLKNDLDINYAQILELPTAANALQLEMGTLFKKDLCYLCHNILQNTCISLNCDRASLFLSHGTAKKRYLISKLFDVTSTSLINETLHTEENAIRIPFGKGIVGYVAENNCLLNINDAYDDPRFLDEIDKRTGFHTKSILSTPVTDRDGIVIGVAQVINKKHGKYFDSHDENLFQSVLSFCGISINNEQLLEMSQKECNRHQLILKLTKCVLKEQINFRKLISEILQNAMEMLNCSKICVYLTDNRINMTSPTESSKVFQLLRDDKEVKEVSLDPKYITAIDQNLRSINIIDSIKLRSESKDMLITVEGDVGNWLLCMTITNTKSMVIGCIIFVRNSEDVFNQSDINIMETFALICGISIHNCRLYDRSVRMLAQREVINEVLAYHTTCDRKVVESFLKLEPRSSEEYHIYSFDFDESIYSDDETVLLCVRIFLEKKALIILNLSLDVLYRIILTAKKNYRLNTYHNWRHAITVTQAMFSILTTGRMQLYFSEFEQICLLIAGMFHDLDHRGKNNAFQLKTSSPFAKLYNTSVLEHHHIDRTIMILNTAETNIFQNLPAKHYQHGVKFIEKAILATDLQNYLTKRIIFREKLESGDKTFDSQESIDLLMGILMTACDLTAITKPWEVQRSTAVKIAAEFFEQGDEEKHLQQEVPALMDRENRYNFPKMQIEYIDTVCVPIYRLLSEVEDSLTPLYEGVIRNRTHWSNINQGIEYFDIDFEIQSLYSKNTALNLCADQKHLKFNSYFEDARISTTVYTQTTLIFPKIKEEQKQISQKSCQTDVLEQEIQEVCNVIKIFGSDIILETAKENPDEKLLSLKVSQFKDKHSISTQTQIDHPKITTTLEKNYGYVSNKLFSNRSSTSWNILNLEPSDFILSTKASGFTKSARSSGISNTFGENKTKSYFEKSISSSKSEEPIKTVQAESPQKSIQLKEDLMLSKMMLNQPLLKKKSPYNMFPDVTEENAIADESTSWIIQGASITNLTNGDTDVRDQGGEISKFEQKTTRSAFSKSQDEIYGMSAEEREAISSTAMRELNQYRRRKCLKKVPRNMPNLTKMKVKQRDYLKKCVCQIS